MPRKKATPVVPTVAAAAEVNTVEVSVIAEPPSKRGRKPKTTVAPVATNPASDETVETTSETAVKTTPETAVKTTPPDFNWGELHPDVRQQRQYSPVTLRLSLVAPGMPVKHSPLLTGIGMGSADCAGSSDDLDDGLLSEANRLKNLYWHSLLFRSQWCQSCQFQADCQGYATTEPASNSSIADWEQALPDYWLWVPVVNQAQSFACLVCSQFRYPGSSESADIPVSDIPVSDIPVSVETHKTTSETTVTPAIAALPAAIEPAPAVAPAVAPAAIPEVLPGTCLQTPGKYRGYTLWTEAYVVGCAVADCTYTKQNVRCQHAKIQWRSAYKPGIWVHTATTVKAAQGAVRLAPLHDTSVAAYAAAKDAVDALIALDHNTDQPDPPIPIPPGGWLHHYLAYRDGTGIYRSAHAKTKRK